MVLFSFITIETYDASFFLNPVTKVLCHDGENRQEQHIQGGDCQGFLRGSVWSSGEGETRKVNNGLT